MTAGGYGYGSMRATDADRESARTILQDAHTQGRLSWEEFDSRSTALASAQTYDQLAGLTADLPNPMPATQPQGVQDYQGPGYAGAGNAGAGYAGTGPQGAGYAGPGYAGPGYAGAGYAGAGFQGAGYAGPGFQGAGFQGPGPQGAGYPVGYPGAQFAPAVPTNSLAVASLICGVLQVFFWFFSGIPAIILGHIARRRIRATGEQGAGMALAGIILGYVGLAFAVLFGIAFVVIVIAAAHSTNDFQPPPSP